MGKDNGNVIARQIGQRVRTGRVFKGLSACQLAARAGLTERRLVRVEVGTAGVTADELVTLARALELPLWFVFEVSASGCFRRLPDLRQSSVMRTTK